LRLTRWRRAAPRRRLCGAAHLVRVNLGMLRSDERLGRAAEFADGVARAGGRALAE
jgi:hypothetical protein